MNFDVENIRKDFPILNLKIRNKPLIYFDNAATTQKPQVVIDKINKYYREENSNIHRGIHYLSEIATKHYEETRKKVQKFINARFSEEIIFTRGTTESINLVANVFSRKFLKEGDEILISAMEHHSNIVPWQIACEEKNAKLKVIPINDNGEIILEKIPELISSHTKLISIVHISNSLGTINPIEDIIKLAHDHNIPVLIDSAQSIQHLPIDVSKLGCDFLAFSGHKMYGPTGVGVLYGRKELLNELPPYQGGGDMILSVSFEKTIYNNLPYKYEAGTPHIEGVIGLGSAIDYISSIGLQNIFEYEKQLLEYATEKISEIPEVKIIGTAKNKASVISFIIENIHPHDIGTLLDREGIAIRTGHHCTEPIMTRFNIPATARASFAFYNTKEEIDHFISALKEIIKMFS